jgi:nucleoside-diphosphate-sugar epimerase
MKVFVFGGTGYIGKHVIMKLVEGGHTVDAFARSEKSKPPLSALGARAVVGDVMDAAAYEEPVRQADAVIWIAQLMHAEEHSVVSTLLQLLKGGNKTFIFTGGASLLSIRTDGDWLDKTFTEDDEFVPRRQIAPRLAVENMVRAAAGVRAMCVRPPLVWGNGGCKVISDMYFSAKKTGGVCHVGRGLNCYSNVHVEDLADLYVLALQKGVPGALYHAVSGELNYRAMAEAIARQLKVSTRSVTVEEAIQVWDRFTGPIVFSSCSRTVSPRARRELGWTPQVERLDIFAELANPVYDTPEDRALPAWVTPGAR